MESSDSVESSAYVLRREFGVLEADRGGVGPPSPHRPAGVLLQWGGGVETLPFWKTTPRHLV